MQIRIPKNVIGIVCVVFFIIGIMYLYLPRYSRYQELQTKELDIDTRIAELESKIEEMKHEKDLLQNDVNYLEKVVREKLGRVEPGETVYKVVESDDYQKE